MLRVAKTENGIVRGIEAADPRITVFKGIPFAAPPIGKNRWRAPQPCESWDGVKDTCRFAPISVQDTPGLGNDIYCREWHVDPDIAMSEDCLYLNVWTPAKNENEKLPVVVWYFGGGLLWGYPSEMEFDGERLARRGIIVVSVNYRINVFGFLAHPQITAEAPEAPANFGNLDQQAGLKWVVRNIAGFGGDPDNITIAGQSAGGGSVLSQMAAPSSEGLFKKAIIQSAMIRSPYREPGVGQPETLESAQKHGEKFFEYLGVESLDEARKLDAKFILHKYNEYVRNNPRMFTVLDGKFCVGDPLALWAQNKIAKVKVMAGNTSDEFPSFINIQEGKTLADTAGEIFGDRADEFLAFKQAHEGGNGCYGKISGIECTIKAIALQNEKNGNDNELYYYCFDADIPGWDNPGTFHSVELWFFFETLAKCWRPFKGVHYDLARQMCNYWANFVKTGNPNGEDVDGTDMPRWDTYTKEKPCSMIFKTEGPITVTEDGDFKKFLIDESRNILLENKP